MNLRTLLSTALVAAAGIPAAVPAHADAKTVPAAHYINALLPTRIAEQIGFVPIVGMQRLGAVGIRYRGDVHRGEWFNSLATRLSLTESLKEIRQTSRGGFSSLHGVYADRALTSAERRHFQVLLDLGRDADVLVVQAGHPACNGLTLAQARAIASGKITSWADVGASPGAAGRIALRDAVVRGSYEPRFGAAKKPSAAKGRADGGIADAAQDASVAAITSWSRARSRGGVCTVPIGGVQPSNLTVHSLEYPAAYPVTFVAPRKRRRDGLSKARLKLYLKFLKSDAAAKAFRGNGLLLTADKPSSDEQSGGGGSAGGPSQDAQGRPITPVRDDNGAGAALEGERLQQQRDGSYIRYAFEPGGLMNVVEGGDSTTCSTSSGSWAVLEGWRYSENGGGFIIRVRFNFERPVDATIELPGDTPGAAWYDGQQWERSRSLAGSC